MFTRLPIVFKFAVVIGNRSKPTHLVGIQRRFEFRRHCTTLTWNTNDSENVNLKKLLEKVQTDNAFDTFQALQILRCCVRSSSERVNQEIIESIWAELRKKTQLNEEHYLQFMKYYECIHHTDGIIKTFDEICALGLQPRSSGYMMVLRAHLQKGDTKRTWKFLSEMEKANICMDEKSLHNVLGHFLGKGDYKLATKAIELLKEYGHELDFNALTKQWKYYARGGDIKSIRNSLEYFIKNGINLRVKDMVELTFELSVSGYSHHVNVVLCYLDNIQGVAAREKETINRYVEGGQSHIVPKVMQAIGVNVDEYKSNLVSGMKRSDASHHEIEQTMQNVRLISRSKSLESNSTTCTKESRNDAKKHVSQSEDSQFEKLIRKRDCTGIEYLIARGNLQMTPRKYSAIVKLYIEEMQLEKAINTFKQAVAVKHFFKLTPGILSNLVKLMVINERDIDEIKELLAIHRMPKATDRAFEFASLFQQLADSGNSEILQQLYDAVTKNNITKEYSLIQASLVSVHLTNNNLNAAIEAYERFVITKNVAPYTVELMSTLIQRNEWQLLQRVYKVYEGARTVNLAQYRLAIAYLECDHEQKARSILENVNMKEITKIFFRHCKSLENLKKVDKTKSLLRLTKGLPCDRHLIYRTLLEIYCKTGQTENAITLWTEHEADETTKPRKDFLDRLFYYLTESKVEIPNSLLSQIKKMRTSNV